MARVEQVERRAWQEAWPVPEQERNADHHEAAEAGEESVEARAPEPGFLGRATGPGVQGEEQHGGPDRVAPRAGQYERQRGGKQHPGEAEIYAGPGARLPGEDDDRPDRQREMCAPPCASE